MKNKIRKLPVALTGVLLLSLLPITGLAEALPKPPPPPQPSSIYGIELIQANPASVSLVEAAGAHWVRRNGVKWDEIEAVEGQYNWAVMADLEQEMILLNQQGMALILIVRGVPEWARTPDGYVCGPIAPNKYKAFASFMRALVRRYSQPPYNVRYWEIGNEPDAAASPYLTVYGCWGDPEDDYYGGQAYGEMLKVVYRQIKSADKNAQVLIGGLLLDCDPNNPPIQPDGTPKDCSSAYFLEGILRAGAGSSFDAVSYHSYDYYGYPGFYANLNWGGFSGTTGPILDIKADFIRATLAKYRQAGKPLFNTETALLCDDSLECQTTQAYYVAHVFVDALKSGVNTSIWYSLNADWRNTDLIKGNTPKPAYSAFQASSAILGQARYVQQVDREPGLAIFEFTKDGHTVWALWSQDGAAHTLMLASLPAQAWNVFGDPLAPTLELGVGLEPLYLEW